MAGPEIKEVRKMLEDFPIKPDATIEEMRKGMEEAFSAFPLPEDVKITDVDAGGVPSEWIVAPDASKDKVILYLHGGGYVLGSPRTHRAITTKLSQDTGARVLCIDYRLAPEHPFPAAVEDAVKAYRWLLDQGIKPSNVAVSGDSAGGGLTIAALLAFREEGLPMPACAAPISPWVDMTGTSESLTTRADRDPMVQREGLLGMAAAYLAGQDAKLELASPIFADLKGLPPLLIQVGGDETLHDDAAGLDANARKAGVQSMLEVWDEMIHVWHAFHPILPEGAQALERIAQFMTEQWAGAAQKAAE